MTSYLDILSKIEQKPERKLNDHVLVIDSMNTFIRSFAMLQSMNPQGHHTGGMVGFLRSMGHLMKTFEPTRIICVFDGAGSSINRKNIDSDYKANRNIKRITNWELFDNKEDEYASMTMQMGRLVEYLQCLPVQLMSIDKVEADDIISYISQKFGGNGKRVTIVSSDKDFLQIVDDNIEVYSPIKKMIYRRQEVITEMGMLPNNYLILKALLGDKSDNLTGVKGLGPKTVIKEFPRLIDDPTVTLEDIFAVCEEKMGTKKVFANIVYNWDKVETNHTLMNLLQPRISEEEESYIIGKVSESIPPLQTGPFLHMLEMDNIDSLNKNTEGWLEIFRPLTTYKK